MKIKAALIDLNDTICNNKKVSEDALDAVAEYFAKATENRYSPAQFHRMYKRAERHMDLTQPEKASSYNVSLHLQHVVESSDLTGAKFQLLAELQREFYDYVEKNIELHDHADSFLYWLKESDRKIVLITDGNADVKIRKVNNLKLYKYIDYLVTSEESSLNKPSPNSYVLGLQKLDMRPKEVVMIGSKKEVDIYGANNLGITTVEVTQRSVRDKKSIVEPPTVESSGERDLEEISLFKPKYKVNSLEKVKDIVEFIDEH